MLSQKELAKELMLFGFERQETKRTSGSHVHFVYKNCDLLEVGFGDHKDVTNITTGAYGDIINCLTMLTYYYVVENQEINKEQLKIFFKGHDKGLQQEILKKLKKLIKEKEVSWAKMLPSSIYRKVEYFYQDVNNETIEKYFKKGDFS